MCGKQPFMMNRRARKIREPITKVFLSSVDREVCIDIPIINQVKPKVSR